MVALNQGPSMMETRRTETGDGVMILYNSDYAAKAITLDGSVFADSQIANAGFAPAGLLIAEDGTNAHSNGTPFGVLLHDVYIDRPQATVVYRGAINTQVAADHIFMAMRTKYNSTQTEKLKNVVFIGLDSSNAANPT